MNDKNVLNFALIGSCGFIAPRHLKAIRDTGNKLIAAVDPNDSAGILDSYFPETEFFKEYELFERFADYIKKKDPEKKIDYFSICTPNYLHDSHIFSALKLGANVICEKPLVLNPERLDQLEIIEKEIGIGKINTVLQLRLHDVIKNLKNKIEKEPKGKKYDIELTYITPRGKWYQSSWKWDMEKSGGVVMNIGIHFLDMLMWIFGPVKFLATHLLEPTRSSGFLELENANVRWFLSIDKNDLASHGLPSNKPFRSIKIDGEELNFSEGFTDLHTLVYQETISGRGSTISDVRPSIELVYLINHSSVVRKSVDYCHPFILDNNLVVSFVAQKPAVVVANVKFEKNVTVGKNVSFGENVVIGNNVVIHDDTVIGSNVRIDDGAVIGKLPMKSLSSATTSSANNSTLPPANIGDGCIIGSYALIYRGSKIDKDVLVADAASVRENVTVGERTIIGRNVTVENKVTIGKFCKIQTNASIAPYSVVEDYVFISPGVATSNDRYAGRTKKRFDEYKGITIKKGARLGIGSVTLPGVTINEDAMIGAGSVVTKDVNSKMVVYGSPAKEIRPVPDEQLLENQI